MEFSFTREIRVPVGDPSVVMIRIEKFLPINIGDIAPELAGATLDGKEIRLADLRGKVVLLDFWATWCAPCLAELPNLRRAYDKYSAEGKLVVIGISLDDDVEGVRSFVKERGIPWPLMVGGPAESNLVAKAYNVSGVPATFLIGSDGKVVAKDLTGQTLHDELAKLFPAVAQALPK